MKKEEDAAKEAFAGGTFAQFLACLHVGGKHERFFWFLGFQAMTATACKVAWIQEISRRPKSGGIQADDAGADSIQAHRPLKPRARKGRIMERFRGRGNALAPYFIYGFPAAMHRHIQTTNAIESLFSNVRQRTDQIDVFTTETSCLAIVWATIQDIRLHKISL